MNGFSVETEHAIKTTYFITMDGLRFRPFSLSVRFSYFFSIRAFNSSLFGSTV